MKFSIALIIFFSYSCAFAKHTLGQHHRFFRCKIQSDAGKKKNKLSLKDAIWDYDGLTRKPVRLKKLKQDTLTAENLIRFLNEIWQPDIKLDFVKIKGSTIYVKIKESAVLTQQMGTSGAEHYMVTTTFTLTELPGIKYVNFNFEEGDHAVPGTYTRWYFYKRRDEQKKTNAQKLHPARLFLNGRC